MKRSVWMAVSITVFAVQTSPLAHAQPASAPAASAAFADPTARRHDGFFLRLLAGPAGFATATTIGADDVKVSGGGGGFSVALGGAVGPSLIVYGEVFDDVAVGPTLTVNGQDQGMAGSDVSAGVVGIGPGLAYYTASNLYLSATLALSQLSVRQNGNDVAHSGNGFGVSAALGKEWWVSDQWGLGLAGQLYLGSIPDGSANVRWTTAGVMVAFSATYN